jgi:hypothetical protein
MPPLALHQWVPIDTWSVAAVIWDEPILLQMGSKKCYRGHWAERFASA